MYHQKGKNKVNRFVKDCISSALFKLMEIKPFEDITVTELINKAGVSRMGFYRNYRTKVDVLEDFILTVFEDTVEKIKRERELDFKPYNVIKTVLENFRLYAEYINLCIEQKLDFLIYNCYKKAFSKLDFSDRVSPLRFYYGEVFVANLFAIEVAWVRRGMKESPDKLAAMYSKILAIQSKM